MKKERDMEIYDVWESPDGNVCIKLTDSYSVSIGHLSSHGPDTDEGSRYIGESRVTPARRIGRIVFD